MFPPYVNAAYVRRHCAGGRCLPARVPLGLTWADIQNGPPELRQLIDAKLITPPKPSAPSTSPDSISFASECTIKTGEYTRLAAAIQGALFARGAINLKLDGIWSADVCEAWWRIVKQPLGEDSVRDLLQNQTISLCSMVVTESCGKPGAGPGGGPPGSGSSSGTTWLIAGAAVLAAAFLLTRK